MGELFEWLLSHWLRTSCCLMQTNKEYNDNIINGRDHFSYAWTSVSLSHNGYNDEFGEPPKKAFDLGEILLSSLRRWKTFHFVTISHCYSKVHSDENSTKMHNVRFESEKVNWTHFIEAIFSQIGFLVLRTNLWDVVKCIWYICENSQRIISYTRMEQWSKKIEEIFWAIFFCTWHCPDTLEVLAE